MQYYLLLPGTQQFAFLILISFWHSQQHILTLIYHLQVIHLLLISYTASCINSEIEVPTNMAY